MAAEALYIRKLGDAVFQAFRTQHGDLCMFNRKVTKI